MPSDAAVRYSATVMVVKRGGRTGRVETGAAAPSTSCGGAAGRPSASRDRVRAVRRLLDEDRFTRIRSEAELTALVRAQCENSNRPYAELMHGLIGLDPDVEETVAKRLWMAAVEHKRALSVVLGREVLLRVAMLDLFSTKAEIERNRPPVVVSRRLLGGVLRAMATDPLTGLMRREEFATIVAHELRQRSKTPPVLAYIDIDDFKSVNDSRGHAAGDLVLSGFGRLVAKIARSSDAFARLGGDEFGALFVDCGVGHARRAIERLRTAFRRATAGLGVDLAVGLVVGRAGESPTNFIARADRAMYGVKRRRKRAAVRARDTRVRATATVVALVSEPETLHELHTQLAHLGCTTIPARSLDASRTLIMLLQPRFVVVSEAGQTDRWLMDLARDHPGTRRVRLLSEGEPVVGPSTGELVVRRPLATPANTRLLRALVGRAGSPVPFLHGPREAQGVALAIKRLLDGRLPPGAATRLHGRPEIDLVRRHLGG